MAKCPSHADDKHSLSVCRGDDARVLMKCHAGCEVATVVEALGLRMTDIMPPREEGRLGEPIARYEYRAEDGTLLYRVLRFHPKDFRPQLPSGSFSLNGVRRVLYRLPEIVTCNRAVWITEGEKDADNLAALGMVATTSGGATTWRDAYAESLRARHVMIVPDNDDAGFAYAEAACASLLPVAASVRIVVLPGLKPKEDVSDWLAKGGTRNDLEALAKAVRPEEPTWDQKKVTRELIRLAEQLAYVQNLLTTKGTP
jgi:hypothetical protein